MYIYNHFKQPATLPVFLLLFAVTLSSNAINVGFGIKPYMIFVAIFFLCSIRFFKVHKPLTYELFLIVFYMYYCLTGLVADYPSDSLRLIFGIGIVLTGYFIMRFVFSRVSIDNLEKTIAITGVLFNILSLALYFIGIYKLGFNFFGNGIKSFGVLIDRGTPRLVGTFTDPNIFSFCNFIFFYYYLTHFKEKLL